MTQPEQEEKQVDITSLITISFDDKKFVPITYKKELFALYEVRVRCNTVQKTAWSLHLRYSDIEEFHAALTVSHNKHSQNTNLILPPLPPKRWQRNKFDTVLITKRIQLFNVYVERVCTYVCSACVEARHLFFNFFQISNHLYKYVVNDDMEMVRVLRDYIHVVDDNRSNIFHYAVSQRAKNCVDVLLSLLQCEKDDHATLRSLLTAKDQFQWTPLSLAKYFRQQPTGDDDGVEKDIYDALQSYGDDAEEKDAHDGDNGDNDNGDGDGDDDAEEKQLSACVDPYMPVQYRRNIQSHDYRRKLWVIVNPSSGKSQGVSVWNDAVKPFLDYHTDTLSYDVLLTTHQFHAQQQCEQLAVNHDYTGIVCIGGDGTIAEIANGLYRRRNQNKEKQKNEKLSVAAVAAGSGNALATELKMDNLLAALRKIYAGFETCIDAYVASQTNETATYSFVSTQWGTISTIDLESESMRWIGAFRFTLKGLSEVAWSSHYKARVYFKPTAKGADKVKQTRALQLQNKKDAPPTRNNDGNWWHEIPTSLSVPPHQVTPYPSDWVCVTDDFGLLCVTNLRWIAEDSCMGGMDFDARSNALRLVYNGRVGRMEYANILLGLETGKHLQSQAVHYYDVEQVVIEPLMNGPPIDVDGERKPLKPVHIKLLPSDFVVIG